MSDFGAAIERAVFIVGLNAGVRKISAFSGTTTYVWTLQGWTRPHSSPVWAAPRLRCVLCDGEKVLANLQAYFSGEELPDRVIYPALQTMNRLILAT
ncbi:hypothetical protein EBB_22375 [Methylomonas sp. EbB]|uniref:Uncharacterized protein n=1 Tax=Methylomonas fluvii TaxID=1854564 RepID=A0ABR9DK25_9GAMM|nr:hypothetical protein [Methylomonas fluvii]MBD9363176.1 hypothetical protein [Methylomonas fluvii]